MAWSPDDRELVFHTNGFHNADDSFHIVDVGSGNIRKSVLEGVGHHLRKTGYSSDGKYFASIQSDETGFKELIQICDASTGETMATGSRHNEYIYCVDWHPDNLHVASSGTAGDVKIWNMQTGQSQVIWQSNMAVPQVQWSTDGKFLSIADWNDPVRVWDHRNHGASVRTCKDTRPN